MSLLCCAEQPFWVCVCVWEKRNMGAMWGWRCERKPNRPLHLCTIRSTTAGATESRFDDPGARLGGFQVFQEDLTLSSAAAPVSINRAVLPYLAAYDSHVLKGDMKRVPESYKFFCWLLCSVFFFFYIYIFSHCDDCGPIAMAVILTTFHMACGSASSAFYFFYFIHLSRWHRSDETNSEVLSSSDVVGFQRGVNKKQQGPLRIASERRDMISGSRTPLGRFFFFFNRYINTL